MGHQEFKYCGSSRSEASPCGIAELFTCRVRSRVKEGQQARLTERQAKGKKESRWCNLIGACWELISMLLVYTPAPSCAAHTNAHIQVAQGWQSGWTNNRLMQSCKHSITLIVPQNSALLVHTQTHSPAHFCQNTHEHWPQLFSDSHVYLLFTHFFEYWTSIILSAELNLSVASSSKSWHEILSFSLLLEIRKLFYFRLFYFSNTAFSSFEEKKKD